MSAKLAMRVADSALPAHLKWTLVVLALYATDEGERVFPSMPRMARQLGVSVRQARANVTALCGLRVLIPVTPRIGGAGRTTHYRIDASALPSHPVKGGSPLPTCHAENTEAHFPVLSQKGGSPLPETRKSDDETRKRTSENPEVHFRRSVIDQSVDQPKSRTAAAPRSILAKEPNGDNLTVITRLALEILEQGEFKSDVDPEFIEATKQLCADKRIDYGRHPDVAVTVVREACHRAGHWAAARRAAGVKVRAS